MTKGSQKDLAAYLGVNKSTVSRAVAAGRLAPGPDGLFDFAQSAARWRDTAGGRTDVAARHAAERGAELPLAQPGAENPTAAAKSPDAGQASAAGGRTRYKTAVLHYENASIKLDMALRRGLRYPLAGVGREAQALGATIRAAMERIIDQTAPRLAVAGNRAERARLLDAELRRLRWMVKRELPAALRRMKQAGQGGQGGGA